jgi:hypothetical protein
MSNPATNAVMGDLGEIVADGTAIAMATQFSVNPKRGESAWGDSDSAGYTHRKGARKDCTGSLEGKFNSVNPPYSYPVYIDDEPELVLWMTTTLYWDIPCGVITTMQLQVNMDSKEVVGWTADWGASGIFYYPGQSGAPAKTYPT